MTIASPLWIKICANTSLEDALLAADMGADAVGFIFAPSPRRVTAEQVAAITSELPAALEKIGVFVDATLDDICSTVRKSGLTGVQLHSQGGSDLPARLRAKMGPSRRILKVVHYSADAALQAREAANDPNIDAILVDSRTATAVGGTGITFNWGIASKTIFQSPASQKPIIAAGGLTPENVREAIAVLRPWGVDVTSGVESSPGRKDPAKLRAFIAAARQSPSPSVR